MLAINRLLTLIMSIVHSPINYLLNPAYFMTEILLHYGLPGEIECKKIQPSLYFSQTTKLFYRLSFLPSPTLFHNDQVSQPPLATFTRYDPRFLLINSLLKGDIIINTMPFYFKELNLSELADIKNQNSYVLNREKAFNFLEQKVGKIQGCLIKELGKKALLVEGQTDKHIEEQTIIILKSQIENSKFVDDFAKERFHYEPPKKHLVDSHREQQANVSKKTKNPPKKSVKKQDTHVPSNQKTLFGFMKKKQ